MRIVLRGISLAIDPTTLSYLDDQEWYCHWPPVWRAIDPNRDENPLGEIGILDDVVMSEFFDTEIFVLMVYQGWRYTGVMAFDSPEFCRQIYSLFKSNIGRSIKNIGALDLSIAL